MSKEAEVKTVWMEEYKHCSCSFVDPDKSKLPGYCPRHANDKKWRRNLPDVFKGEYGYVES